MVEALKERTLRHHQTSRVDLILADGRFVSPKTLEIRLNDVGSWTSTMHRCTSSCRRRSPSIANGPEPPSTSAAQAGDMEQVDFVPRFAELRSSGRHLLQLDRENSVGHMHIAPSNVAASGMPTSGTNARSTPRTRR